MSVEETNLAAVRQWMDNYNNDPHRMVRESYTEDCTAEAMGLLLIEGRKQFLEVEDAVMEVAPGRRARIVHMHSAGDTVIVEAILNYTKDGGEEIETPWCAVLTLKDGKIVTDRTYLDRTLWPGL